MKNSLRNSIFLAAFSCVAGASLARAEGLWVKMPEALDDKGAVRRDALLVRYRPTKKSLLLGLYGKAKLTPKLLENLGVEKGVEPKAGDFEFSRVFATTRRRGAAGSWDAGIESWTMDPATKDLLLAKESLSVMRTRAEGSDTVLDLAPTSLALGPIAVPNKTVSSEDPAKAKAARRKVALAQLERSWQQVVESKYDLALVGFGAIQSSMAADLNAEELNKAQFGGALARFHQMGCREAGPEFEKLQTPGPYYEDARYYGALCALDRGDNDVAHQRFRSLLEQNSPRYEDAARFYLGVVAEARGDLSSAESAYLDTVDFASDASIVALAKEKLAVLEDKKAADRYAKKLVSVMASAGLGWDSNALSLPTNVQPADLNLETGASGSYLALAYIDLKNPLLRKLGNKFHYTYLMLGYLNGDIAETSDLQSHGFGTSVEWGSDVGYKSVLDLKYSLTYLGQLASSSKYLTSYGARWDLSKVVLDSTQQNLDHMWLHGFEVTRQDPAAEPSSADSDNTAWLFSGSHRKRAQHGTKMWGPSGEWEYKMAKGKDARYLMLGAGGSYEQPLGPDLWKLKFTQDAGLRGTFYYQSSASRKDYLVTATSALSRPLSDKFEARTQLVLSKNFSKENYSYNRWQVNLLLNAFF